jgi:GNAT superfamily N-acetyltransferase
LNFQSVLLIKSFLMIKHPELPRYTISTDRSMLNLDVIHNHLSNKSYWAIGIPFETVQRSIDNSMCFGIYHNNEQVGFARLITDKATFAYLADVFILQEHRGKGLSKWLMQTIQDHPELQGLRRWLLGTRDAHALYEQFGWTVLSEEVRPRFMQRHFPEVYKTTDNI